MLESLVGRIAHEATLSQWRQHRHLVAVDLAKRTTVVQVQHERLVAERDHLLVVMSIHVTGDEIEDGHVHEVENELGRVVDVFEQLDLAVRVVDLPQRFLSLRVRASIRMIEHLPFDDRLRRQHDLYRTLHSVSWTAAYGVCRVAVVRTMTGEAHVASYYEYNKKQKNQFSSLILFLL